MEDQCRYYAQRDPDVREAVIALEVARCRFNMAEEWGKIDEACRALNEAERRLKAAIQRAREVRN